MSIANLDDFTPAMKQQAAALALGRIFRMGSRPSQPGDIAEYERCRAIVIAAQPEAEPDYVPNWVRDRNKGSST